MSQAALSEFSGGTITPDFISLVERGISAPSFESIELLASALAVDITTLFTFPAEESKRRRVAKGTVPKRRGRKAASRTTRR